MNDERPTKTRNTITADVFYCMKQNNGDGTEYTLRDGQIERKMQERKL